MAQQRASHLHLALYGISFPIYLSRFKRIMTERNRTAQFWDIMVVLAALPIIAGVCFWQADRIESKRWPQQHWSTQSG